MANVPIELDFRPETRVSDDKWHFITKNSSNPLLTLELMPSATADVLYQIDNIERFRTLSNELENDLYKLQRYTWQQLLIKIEKLNKEIRDSFNYESCLSKLDHIYIQVLSYSQKLQQVKHRKLHRDFKDFSTGNVFIWPRNNNRNYTVGNGEPNSNPPHIDNSNIQVEATMSAIGQMEADATSVASDGVFVTPPEELQLLETDTCATCSWQEWSLVNSKACYNKTVDFLQWTDVRSIILMIFTGALLVVILSAVLIFARNYSTAAVQASGGYLSFLMLFSLVCSCCSICLFITRPTQFSCLLRQVVFSVSFTISMSVPLAKSFQLANIYMFQRACVQHYQGYILMVINIIIHTGICTIWWYLSPDLVNEVYESPDAISLMCARGSIFGFVMMLCYSGILATICAACVFLVANSENTYNMANSIRFVILIYFLAWIFFIPIYATANGISVQYAEAYSGLMAAYGIFWGYFAPKIYIILFKSEYNSFIYFQHFLDSNSSGMYPGNNDSISQVNQVEIESNTVSSQRNI
ncbi:G-protein coupled receptor family C group 6 member A-like [Protopterus annectens]|uniref:G-protein coupled receptor family C group 6 member A-like n=1 Tax=Protopterus annectens TaxID=7888 RepID=UPI001CFC0093|nr:G-protein coupled receptor family C group 6 member A-like [Protopterus annectens]